jgi:hypothetical protein
LTARRAACPPVTAPPLRMPSINAVFYYSSSFFKVRVPASLSRAVRARACRRGKGGTPACAQCAHQALRSPPCTSPPTFEGAAPRSRAAPGVGVVVPCCAAACCEVARRAAPELDDPASFAVLAAVVVVVAVAWRGVAWRLCAERGRAKRRPWDVFGGRYQRAGDGCVALCAPPPPLPPHRTRPGSGDRVQLRCMRLCVSVCRSVHASAVCAHALPGRQFVCAVGACVLVVRRFLQPWRCTLWRRRGAAS